MSGILHPKCGKRFPNGSRAGHCAGCCETFIGNTAFEAHRAGEHGTPERRCEIGPNHWQDDRGHWHVGPRLTEEQKAKMWPKDEEA
jgi:hypothetical protein